MPTCSVSRSPVLEPVFLGQPVADDAAGAVLEEGLALVRRELHLGVHAQVALGIDRELPEEVLGILVDAAEPVGPGDVLHVRRALDDLGVGRGHAEDHRRRADRHQTRRGTGGRDRVEAVEHRAQRREQEHRKRDADHRQSGAALAAPRALEHQVQEFHDRCTTCSTSVPFSRCSRCDARSAACGSCVTMTIVFLNSSFSRCSSVSTSPADLASRSPVGSSASSSVGSVTMAARDRDALLLSARELTRIMPIAVGEPDDAERGHDVIATLCLGQVGQQQRQLDVLEGGQHRDQVIQLEDEADVPRPPGGQRPLGQTADLGVADPDRAARRPVDPGEQVQQRRLAGARRPHQSHEVAGVDGDRHAIENRNLDRIAFVGLGDVAQLDQRHGPISLSDARRRGRSASPAG